MCNQQERIQARKSRRRMNSPAPDDCELCRERGFTKMAQHLGHLGGAALGQYKAPRDCGSCRMIERRTGKWPTMSAHHGHMGFEKVLQESPWSLTSSVVRKRITGR